MLEFVILTLFPEMIQNGVNYSILKQAMENEYIQIHVLNIRDFTLNKQRQVDDAPYGGGAGMVLMVEPIFLAIQKAKEILGESAKVYFMSPRGKTFSMEQAKTMASEKKMIFLCGHYEGVDERAIEMLVDAEISIGDFILTGGELPALVIIDAISRLFKGVLSNEDSTKDESFEDHLLGYPQYTRPQNFMDLQVPEILLSGHHENIAKFRQEKRVEITRKYRPDLLERHERDRE